MPDDQTEAMTAFWEQSKAEIAQQNSDIDSLRNRAVAMLSVGTLVAGLFGSRLPHANTAGLITALALFAASAVLAIALAWPRDWQAGEERLPIAERVAEGSLTLVSVNYTLAVSADNNWAANRDTMANMYKLFAVLCALTAAQVVAWSLAVI